MPNTFITPAWITQETADHMARIFSVSNWTPTWPEPIHVAMPPMSGEALLALGAAAVIANPEPISRRSMLGLGWWRRHATQK
jgi:hypothetical protein